MFSHLTRLPFRLALPTLALGCLPLIYLSPAWAQSKLMSADYHHQLHLSAEQFQGQTQLDLRWRADDQGIMLHHHGLHTSQHQLNGSFFYPQRHAESAFYSPRVVDQRQLHFSLNFQGKYPRNPKSPQVNGIIAHQPHDQAPIYVQGSFAEFAQLNQLPTFTFNRDPFNSQALNQSHHPNNANPNSADPKDDRTSLSLTLTTPASWQLYANQPHQPCKAAPELHCYHWQSLSPTEFQQLYFFAGEFNHWQQQGLTLIAPKGSLSDAQAHANLEAMAQLNAQLAELLASTPDDATPPNYQHLYWPFAHPQTQATLLQKDLGFSPFLALHQQHQAMPQLTGLASSLLKAWLARIAESALKTELEHWLLAQLEADSAHSKDALQQVSFSLSASQFSTSSAPTSPIHAPWQSSIVMDQLLAHFPDSRLLEFVRQGYQQDRFDLQQLASPHYSADFLAQQTSVAQETNQLSTQMHCQNGVLQQLFIRQEMDTKGQYNNQPVKVALFYKQGKKIKLDKVLTIGLIGAVTPMPEAQYSVCPDLILPNYQGSAAYSMKLSGKELDKVKQHLDLFEDPQITRMLWQQLWAATLDGTVTLDTFVGLLLINALNMNSAEQNQMLSQRVLALSQYLSPFNHRRQQKTMLKALEQLSAQKVIESKLRKDQQLWLEIYLQIAHSDEALAHLTQLLVQPTSKGFPKFTPTQKFKTLKQLARYQAADIEQVLTQMRPKIRLSPAQRLALTVIQPEALIKREWLMKLADLSAAEQQAVLENLFPLEQQSLMKQTQALQMDRLRQLASTTQPLSPAELAYSQYLTPRICNSAHLQAITLLIQQANSPALSKNLSQHQLWLRQCITLNRGV